MREILTFFGARNARNAIIIAHAYTGLVHNPYSYTKTDKREGYYGNRVEISFNKLKPRLKT